MECKGRRLPKSGGFCTCLEVRSSCVREDIMRNNNNFFSNDCFKKIS